MVSRQCGDAPYDGTIGRDILQNIIAIICFFLSGFSGLAFEVAWIQKASLVFGSTTFAVSTVLAVFFLGLAIGSYLFGNISKKRFGR